MSDTDNPVPTHRTGSGSKRKAPISIGELPSIPPPYRPPGSIQSTSTPTSATWEQTLSAIRPRMLAPPRQVHADNLNAYGASSPAKRQRISYESSPARLSGEVDSNHNHQSEVTLPLLDASESLSSEVTSLAVAAGYGYGYGDPDIREVGMGWVPESAESHVGFKRPRVQVDPEGERSSGSVSHPTPTTSSVTFIACHFCRCKSILLPSGP
jgi:hypothetical protein